MSKIFTVLAVSAALAVTSGIACNKSSEGGAPGTTNTFTVSPPTLPVSVKQGDKQTVTLTLNRGTGFQQTVNVTAQEPKGIKVTFDKSTVKAADSKEVAMSVSADKDTPLGDAVIKVTAKPEAGAETTFDVKVTVSAAK